MPPEEVELKEEARPRVEDPGDNPPERLDCMSLAGMETRSVTFSVYYSGSRNEQVEMMRFVIPMASICSHASVRLCS